MSIQTEQPTEAAIDSQQQVAGFRKVLKNRNFMYLWAAQLISQTILNAANFALVAMVSGRSDGAIMASLAVIAFTLPAIPFSVLAGVIVDKVDKRMVLWVSNLVRLFIMLMMFVWLLFDRSNVWPLFGLMFLTSLVGQFFIPAEAAAIPLLVGRRDLVAALSLFNITTTLSQALGFLLLGRVVIEIFWPYSFELFGHVWHVEPTDMVFVVVAFFYAVCVVLILLIPNELFTQQHVQERQSRKGESISFWKALRSLWHDVVEGWYVIQTDRLLFFSVIQLSVVGIIMQLIGALAGVFVQVILNRSPEDMSIVLAPAAIGLVGASVLMPRITRRFDTVALTLVGLFSLAVGFMLLPIFHWVALLIDPANGPNSPVMFLIVVVLVFLLGVAMSCVNVPTNTIMQERAPEEGRARVFSFQYMLYSAGTIPVLLFAGAIAQLFSFSLVVFVISISIILFGLWGIFYLRRSKNEDEINPEAREAE